MATATLAENGYIEVVGGGAESLIDTEDLLVLGNNDDGTDYDDLLLRFILDADPGETISGATLHLFQENSPTQTISGRVKAADDDNPSWSIPSSLGAAQSPFVLDPAGILACLGSPCYKIARRWTFTTSGITDGNCAECDDLNGDWTLTRNVAYGGCVFTATHGVCAEGGASEWRLYPTTSGKYLFCVIKSTYAAKYRLLSTFNCLGPNTLDKFDPSNRCSNFPASITITPASEAVDVWQTINVTDVIQEIVNRPGWASGNHIVLRLISYPYSAGKTVSTDFSSSRSSLWPDPYLDFGVSGGGSGPANAAFLLSLVDEEQQP